MKSCRTPDRRESSHSLHRIRITKDECDARSDIYFSHRGYAGNFFHCVILRQEWYQCHRSFLGSPLALKVMIGHGIRAIGAQEGQKGHSQSG